LLDEIKASQIQEVKVPTTFEELHQTLLFYLGIPSILFGPCSALIAGVKSFATAIQTKKIIFKWRIATNSNLPMKILYAMEIHIQRWLGECQKFGDRSMVNDHLICFDEVFDMVMNSSVNVTLPPNFINPPPKYPSTTTTVMPPEDDEKRKGGKRRKSDEVKGERITKNAAPISEFLLKKGEIWKRYFAGKCSKDCPKWDDTTFMCASWHIHGKCVVNCNNKASHVGVCAVLQEKRNKFKTYLGKVCRENNPSPSA
jgi:hypothetical protein